MTTTTEPTLNLRSPSGLRAWRVRHGLSQKAFGQLLEVTWVAVSRWENGHHAIPRSVELALLYLDQHPELMTTPADTEPEVSASDGLIISLLNEAGVDLSNVGEVLRKYRHDLVTSDVDAAVAGDKRAMIRLRKAIGLRAFK